jgi:hypothetical protein
MVRLAGAYAVGPPSRVVGTEGFARLLDPWSAGGSVLQHPAALPAAASVLGIVSLLVSLAFSVAVVSAPRPFIPSPSKPNLSVEYCRGGIYPSSVVRRFVEEGFNHIVIVINLYSLNSSSISPRKNWSQ